MEEWEVVELEQREGRYYVIERGQLLHLLTLQAEFQLLMGPDVPGAELEFTVEAREVIDAEAEIALRDFEEVDGWLVTEETTVEA